jgi:trimethylamine:corrinoid methyltransferase-like protein
VKKGSKPLAARAAERVQKILDEHRPEPLPDEVKGKLRQIVEQAGI